MTRSELVKTSDTSDSTLNGSDRIQELNIWLVGCVTGFHEFSVAVGAISHSDYDG